MQRALILLCGVVVGVSVFGATPPVAHPLVYRALDDFNDNTLDTEIWNTVAPFTDGTPSSVTETNQRIQIHRRGYLVTKGQVKPTAAAPVKATGQFTLNSSDDFFQLLTRADAIPASSGETNNGIEAFVRQTTGGGGIMLQKRVNDFATTLATGDLSIPLNEPFSFSFTDDGKRLSFTVTQISTPANTITLTSTDATAFTTNYVLFHNREFNGYTMFLDDVAIIGRLNTDVDTPLKFWLRGTDADNDPLTYAAVAAPTKGSLSLNAASGVCTYTPNAGASGTDQFTYSANDGTDTATATTFIFINGQNATPVLAANSVLRPNEGQSATILTANLQVTDADNTPEQITYALLQIPSSGTIRLNAVPLTTSPFNNTFTQADINAKRLSYEHNGTENFSDSMVFSAEDPAGANLSTGAGELLNTDFNSLPAGMQLFGNANLTTFPGEFMLNPSAVSAFGGATFASPGVAFRELNVYFSLYIGNPSLPPADGISFNYGGDIPAAPGYWGYETGYSPDGVKAGTGLTVGIDTYAPPEVVVRYNGIVVAGYLVPNGDTALLCNNQFVNVNISIDSAGQISVVHNSVKLVDNALIPGWNPQPNWSFLIGGRCGSLYETHRLDNLIVSVGGPAEKTFLINIQAINDPPVQTVKNGLVVDQGGAAVVTNTVLNATDPDTAASGISYVLQSLPTHGTLRLNGTPLTVGMSFTQADINNSRVDFVHDGTSIAPDGFSFILFDGLNFVTDFSSTPPGAILSGSAAITANSLHLTENIGGQIGMMIVPSPGAMREFTADFELYIGDGGAADGFSLSYGQFTDVPPLSEEGANVGLSMCFDTYANGGSDISGMGIKYNGGFIAAELAQSAHNSTWTRVTLSVNTAGNVTLTYGGTTLFPNAGNPVVNIATWAPQPSWRFAFAARTGGVSDSHFVRNLKLTSPLTGAPDTLAITVIPVNQTPQVVNNNPLTVNEGATATITTALLRTTDFESQPPALTYSVVAAPNSGTLTNDGQPMVNGRFTQQNIDDGKIAYAHNGGENATDSFTFKVADPDGKETTVRTFAINVSAVNDAPVNTVPGPQTATEDTPFVFSTLRGNAIRTSDVDAASLTVSVSASVLHGTLFASSAGGATVQSNNTGNVTITGSVAQVNAAMDGLTYTPAFNYSGADTLTILTDDLGHSGPVSAADTDTISMTVQAVADAPTVNATDASGQQTVAIPLSITVTLVDNDGSETISQVQITNVPGDATLNKGTDAGNGTWNLVLADLTGLTVTSSGNGSFVLNVSATSRESSNNDVATTTEPLTVTLLSIAPTLSNLAATTIAEGDTTTLSGTISDPGTTDTFTLTVQWGDGTQTIQPYPASATGNQTFSLTHQYADNNPSAAATFTIALNIVDSTFESSDSEVSVTVNNAAPVASLPQGGTPHINEHSTTLSTVATFTDAGKIDTHRVTIDWGDGSPLESSGAANQNIVIVEPGAANAFVGRVNARHTFDDGPVQRPVVVTVIDDDNDQNAVNFNIVVDNMAPMAVFAKTDTTNDAFLGAVGFSAQTEPSNADTAAGLKYGYDLAYNGTTPAFTYGLGDGTYAGGSTEATITIPQQYITTSPNHKVLGRIIDKDGGFTDYILQQPDLHADATHALFASGTLGSSFAYTISADGVPASIVYTIEPVDLPAGVTSLTDVGLSFDGTNGINGTFLKAGQLTIKITAQNAAGKDVAYLVITVARTGGNPSAPIFSSPPQATPNPALSGETVNFSVGATDANGDLISYSWSFGDGTGSRSSSASHKYAAAGVYDATITVSDGPNAAIQHVQVVVLTSPASALTVKSAKITFDFKTPAKSTMQIAGSLPATTLTLAGLNVSVTIAGSGYSHAFQLSSKGSGGDALNALSLGAPKKGAAKFTLKVKSTDGSAPDKPSLFQMLSSLGYTNSTTGKTGPVIFVPLVISAQSSPPINASASIKTKYTATQGKKGSAALTK